MKNNMKKNLLFSILLAVIHILVIYSGVIAPLSMYIFNITFIMLSSGLFSVLEFMFLIFSVKYIINFGPKIICFISIIIEILSIIIMGFFFFSLLRFYIH